MKKMFKLLLTAFLLFTVTIFEHVHDENCGYDSETKTGCIYEVESFLLPPGEEDPSN